MAELAQSPPPFNSLSDELVVQVLHFCRYEEILRFAITNKRHYNILSNSVSLKLHIELEANGLDIIKGSRKAAGTYSRLLDELVRYQDAWLCLDLEEPIERNSHQVMSLWELREDNYVVAFSSTPSLEWGPDSMQLIPIDSSEAPQPVTFPSVFHEFTPDFEQELVVLVKTDPINSTRLEIRLCSTITGLPHPLARNPVFIVEVDFLIPGPGSQTFTLEVIDNILVTRIASIMNYIYEIIVWDWKSGTLLCRVGSPSGVADFSLIDNIYLAVFSVEAERELPRLLSISLYSMLPHTHDETPSFTYFCASKYPLAQPVVTFEFPRLDEFYVVSSRVIMRSDPIPGRVSYTKSASFAPPTALTLSVILSLLRLYNPGADQDSIHLRIFINTRSLLSFLPEMAGKRSAVIPWNVWGVQATRWFLCDKQINYWVYWTSGSRFVRVDENPDSTLHSLSVFDFNQPTVRRDAPRDIRHTTEHHYSLYKETIRSIVLEGNGLTIPHPVTTLSDPSTTLLLRDTIDSDMPTIIKQGFSIPVESRLPYRVVTRPQFVPSCEDWSIDGNHIIGMTPIHGNIDRLSIYKLRT